MHIKSVHSNIIRIKTIRIINVNTFMMNVFISQECVFRVKRRRLKVVDLSMMESRAVLQRDKQI